MSLTSKELNYLIWRYLQESGYDLSAYALDQQSQCSEYENNPTTQELIQKIKPGCLVDLIQKGYYIWLQNKRPLILLQIYHYMEH